MIPDERDATADDSQTARGANWREADLARAIAVAKKSSLQSYRIEIGLDGVIAIIVPAKTEGV